MNLSSLSTRQQNSGNSKNVHMAFTERECESNRKEKERERERLAMTYLHVHIKVDTGPSSQASHSLMAPAEYRGGNLNRT